jgi:pyruvate/2-oxoglutarate dehydrogenase complex dihydrolipoamide acyltransferase (E2) component
VNAREDNLRIFELPDLGEGLVEAQIEKLLIGEGDLVRRFDLVAEVNTDKATVEINIPWSGRITRIFVSEGDYLAVGAAILEVALESAEKEELIT